jgi:hypothetical protein
MKGKKIFFLIVSVILINLSFHLPVFASSATGTIDTSHRYAWGENLGWLNFGCNGCNIVITDTKLTGYFWSRQYGWVNLAPTSSSGVTNNCLGQLGGSAWSSNLGWIDFTGASIDFNKKFSGVAGVVGTKTGRITFNCANCDVKTDWKQCSQRQSPAQVVIHSITDNTVSSITADITITNEGSVDTEYQYEWCVVSNISNDCGGGDDVFYASAAKLILIGQDWDTNLTAVVPSVGTYYFKLVAYFEDQRSVASYLFNATPDTTGGGGGGGGGGGVYTPPTGDTSLYDTADFNRDHIVNSTDFSILLYFWKTKAPYKNIYVDINKDNKVDSVDFSIFLSQWGRKTNGYIPH